jgi:iron only hydrogenase large subunit-like protein
VLPAQLEYKQVRNSDFREVIAELNGQVLRFATAYGFRNIQNIVRAIKSNQCKYDFVEVMACPSGCLNGGGQLKAQAPMTVKQALQAVEQVYETTQVYRLPEHNPAVKQIYQEWLGGEPMKSEALHTKYHFVPKLEISNPLAIQW